MEKVTQWHTCRYTVCHSVIFKLPISHLLVDWLTEFYLMHITRNDISNVTYNPLYIYLKHIFNVNENSTKINTFTWLFHVTIFLWVLLQNVVQKHPLYLQTTKWHVLLSVILLKDTLLELICRGEPCNIYHSWWINAWPLLSPILLLLIKRHNIKCVKYWTHKK